jgi:hypothetical protein
MQPVDNKLGSSEERSHVPAPSLKTRLDEAQHIR